MTRPPFVFGDPQITMMSTGRYMGEPTDPGAPGYYMGETLVESTIYSRYFDGISSGVPVDTLSPSPFGLIRLSETEDVTVVSAGRVNTTIEFDIPTTNEVACEFLIVKGSSFTGPEPATTLFTSITAGTYTVYSGGQLLGAPNGSSTIPVGPDFGAKKLDVADATGFAIGQWVKIQNTVGLEIQIARISNINGTELTFDADILMVVEDNATIETINDVTPLTEVTDYTITLASGDFIINETAATIDKLVWTVYQTDLTDYEGGDFWILPGILPLADYSDPASVSVYPGAIMLGSTNSIETSFSFERDGAPLGRDYTLYSIAKDDESPTNPSLARAASLTHIPARVTTGSILSAGPGSLTISWNDTTLDGSFVTGYNIVRSPGQTFVPALAEKLNVNLITTTQFTDADGAPNRVPVIDVAAPVDGQFYSYSIESAVATGQWTITTLNRRIDQGEILTAEKQLT